MLVEHFLDHPTTVFGVRDVALVDARPPGAVEVARELLEEPLGALLVSAVSGSHRGTLAGQALADRRADTPGPSCDQCNSPGKLLADHSGNWFDDGRDRKSTRLNSSHANISY